jgi:tetratricopeptide (TPR) repeat protein
MTRFGLWLSLLLTSTAVAQAPAPTPAGAAPAEGAPAEDAQGASGEYDPRAMRTEGLDDDAARSRFRIGQALYAEGRFTEAAREFESAYELSRRASLLFNAYLAYRDAGMLEDATRTLGIYLDASPDLEDGPALRARHQAMLRSVEQQRAERDAQAAERQRLEAERERLAREAEEARRREEEQRRRAEAADRGSLMPVGLAVGGAGVAMLATGVVTGLLANAQYDELDENCPDGRCIVGYDASSNSSRGQRLARTTDALLFGGAAVTLTGLVIALLGTGGSSDDEAPVAASAGCGTSGCEAELRVRF